VDGLNTLIADHPAGVVLVFVALEGVLMVLIGVVAAFGKRELRRIENKEVEQDSRLKDIEKDIHGEESDIRIIRQELADHVRKEEKVWTTVERIDRTVVRIEAALPNGDMKVAVAQLGTMSKVLDRVETKIDKNRDQIVDHRVRIAKLEGDRK